MHGVGSTQQLHRGHLTFSRLVLGSTATRFSSPPICKKLRLHRKLSPVVQEPAVFISSLALSALSSSPNNSLCPDSQLCLPPQQLATVVLSQSTLLLGNFPKTAEQESSISPDVPVYSQTSSRPNGRIIYYAGFISSFFNGGIQHKG